MIEIEPEAIRHALMSLIDIKRTNAGCEVQLPLFYPNGDSVTVTVAAERGEYIVHDAGSGAMLLNSHGINVSKNLAAKVARLAAHYGCEFVSGRLSKRCSYEDIGVCAAIVANASRAVGDQLLDRKEQPVVDFRKEVLHRIEGMVGARRYRENEEVYGESGYPYRVSAMVLSTDESHPVGLIEPIKDHDSATKKFREFWDISRSEKFGVIQRISLYNDQHPWNRSDLILLQEVSNLVRAEDAETRIAELLAG